MSDKTLELQIRIAAEDAARIVSALKDDFKALADEAGKYAKNEGEEINKKFKETEEAAKDSAEGINGIKKNISELAEAVVATKIVDWVKDMGVFALQSADNFQTMKNQFGTLLGDMKAGAGLFAEIKAFGDVTPFDLDTLTQATNVLISAKVPLSELQNQLTKFGNLSQGNSQKMTSYVNAFSQASAKGKADMQILNTYLNQGVPILDALAKNFGKTTAEIIDMSSKGEISFADFSKALDDLTAAGGQYFGGMELASKSLAAMQEGLSEAVNTLAASFGEMLMPATLGIVETLTKITNAINENPLLKGIFTAAIITVTGLLGAMAVKTWGAYAAQMALNFAKAASNPILLASTVAVAGLAASYVILAASQEKDKKAMEEAAIAQRKLNDERRNGRKAVNDYYENIKDYDLQTLMTARERLQIQIQAAQAAKDLEKAVEGSKRGGGGLIVSSNEIRNLEAVNKRIKELQDEANKLASVKAAVWISEWSELWKQFQADQNNDKFYAIELERKKKLDDAYNNYVRSGNKEVIDQVNEYYNSKRSEIIKELQNEEARMQRELSKSKIDNLEYQLQEEIKKINELEKARILSAQYTEEEIAAIKNQYDQMRNDTEIKFSIEIDKTKLDEAREGVKNFQEVLSESLTLAMMNMKDFNAQAAVIFADLAVQFTDLAASATLSGFEEFGRALGEGEDAAEAMSRALAAMAQQILKQLPNMFLQAGLQLIAQGQWPLGLGFIAAAGSTAIISGYVDGAKNSASAHAKGGVFDEYGKAAQAFAAGGTFTNQIVSTPTYFAHGGGFGLMGEAGPEAIMPLTRMTDGKLGVQTSGTGSNVEVHIHNYSGEDVRQEETENDDGTRQLEITIGNAVDKHLSSGKSDRAMASRYGLRPVGV